MSVEYYFLDTESRESLFLGCGWESKDIYEKFYDIIEMCVSKHKSFEYFVSAVRKKHVFSYFYDEYEDETEETFFSDEFIKYSLLPMFNWAYESIEKRKGLKLVSDDVLYDEAMRLLFADKGYDYDAEQKKYNDYLKTLDINDYASWSNSHYDKIEDKLYKEYEEEHSSTRFDETTKQWVEVPEHDGLHITDYYFKSLGSLFEFNNAERSLGVTFERALAELKTGKKIWIDESNKFFFIEGKVYHKVNEDYVLVDSFTTEEVLSENWKFE